MNFISAELSKTGGRDENQDFCGMRTEATAGIWALADGLGGHRGGEVASRTAVTAILEQWSPSLAHTPQSLLSLIEAAQSAIIAEQQANPQLSAMRTTLVLLMAKGDNVLWGHCGDSRYFVCFLV